MQSQVQKPDQPGGIKQKLELLNTEEKKMENREDLRSILPFLPLRLEQSALIWPNRVIEALKSLSRGPNHSKVDSGEVLFLAIFDIRNSLSLYRQHLSPSAGDGYALFFDEFLSRKEAAKWFEEVMPAMANLLLRLPTLLELHYRNADTLLSGIATGLRLLEPQEHGIVFLSQELIGALLSCSFLCLFPTANRGAKHLPLINYDQLFASLYDNFREMQEHKIKCLIHYFERICSSVPTGSVSFERKVLSRATSPDADHWSRSMVSLCLFEVCTSGLIEDQSRRALEVDFANKYLGGGALNRGCVQEEIRFMINPELIAGMLFLPSMSDNEAIEIVGSERFSKYTGYASTFRFLGDYVDCREMDSMRRRSTRIVAIDALCSPGLRQYEVDSLLREVNKAFCGFLDQSSYQQGRTSQDDICSGMQLDSNIMHDETVISMEIDEGVSGESNVQERSCNLLEYHNDTGIVTGNWGCGAFGGDPEVKSVLQWLAASQARRPFILYYTFNTPALHNLKQVSDWILSHKWSVGDLWTMLVDYSSKRAKRETEVGFFTWLLPPNLYHHDVPLSSHHSSK